MAYPTDLTDSQWHYITEINGCLDLKRKRQHDLRVIVNAIFYVAGTGCQWRMMPGDLPPWQSVYYYFRRWRQEGALERLHQALHGELRGRAGREGSPSLAIIDAQSVKTTMLGGVRGFDGGKLAGGRKRNLVVDTMGLIMGVLVCAANGAESETTLPLMRRMRGRFGRLCKILGDAAYEHGVLARVLERDFGLVLEVTKRCVQAFVVEPKRWIVERTFAWLGGYRRLSKDYERETPVSEAMILWASVDLMLNRS